MKGDVSQGEHRRPSRGGHAKRTGLSPSIMYYKAVRGLRTVVDDLLMSRYISCDVVMTRRHICVGVFTLGFV